MLLFSYSKTNAQFTIDIPDATATYTTGINNFMVKATSTGAILATMHVIQSDTETSINDMSVEELLMYPNPTSRILNVQLPTTWENRTSRYEVQTLGGQLVMDAQVVGALLTLDLSGFATGYYTLIVNSDDLKLTQKIVEIH